jgi:hypothetical protein
MNNFSFYVCWNMNKTLGAILLMHQLIEDWPWLVTLNWLNDSFFFYIWNLTNNSHPWRWNWKKFSRQVCAILEFFYFLLLHWTFKFWHLFWTSELRHFFFFLTWTVNLSNFFFLSLLSFLFFIFSSLLTLRWLSDGPSNVPVVVPVGDASQLCPGLEIYQNV